MCLSQGSGLTQWRNFTLIWECHLLLNRADAFEGELVEENKILAVTDLGVYTRRKCKTDRLETGI